MHPESANYSGQITPGNLMEQLRGRISVKHYSTRTEQAYVDWVWRFILFHGKRYHRDMGRRRVGDRPRYLSVLSRHSLQKWSRKLGIASDL
jgi:Phage integrase, N-terminal SAM-like domain